MQTQPQPAFDPGFDYTTCRTLRMSPRDSARAAEAVLGRRVTVAEASEGLYAAEARLEAQDAAQKRADTVAAFERSQFAKSVPTTMLYKLINNSRLRGPLNLLKEA